MGYDLLIQGGELLDPGQGLRGIMDIAVKGDRVAAIADHIPPDQASTVVDATGKLVTPGLVDLHTHVYWGVWGICVDPDVQAAKGAVCTQVDAGSADAESFPGFRRFIIDEYASRVFSLLNIAPWRSELDGGIHPMNRLVGNRLQTELTVEENRDVILGLKAFAGYTTAGSMAAASLDMAREVADRRGVPIMTHICVNPPSIGWVVSRLKEGDVLSHCCTGHGQTVLDMNGDLKPEVVDARERGVLLDVGHGQGSFDWRVAQLLVEMGQAPDIISTDLHTGCVNGPVYDLVTTLNKFLCLGMSLEDVILRATRNPGRFVGRLDGIGALKVGGIADISMLDYVSGEFELYECFRVSKVLDKGLVPATSICRGQILSVPEEHEDWQGPRRNQE